MKKLLQNHPGNKNFPVSFRSVFLMLTPARFKAMSKISKQLLFLIPVLVAAIAAQRGGSDDALFLLIGVPAVFLIILFWSKYNQISEQEQYYKLAKIAPLSVEQRLALQLVLPINYADGGWSETLENWPSEVRFKDKQPKFSTFSPRRKTEELLSLEQSWGVLSQKSYERTADNLFNGMHSARFAYESKYHGDDSHGSASKFEVRKERLSELTQLSAEYINNCCRITQSSSPKLLWGFDLWRVSQLAGNAFIAGIITEEQAWADKLKAARYAHVLFESLESFMQNYLLGVAYWSDDLDTTRDRMHRIQDYQTHCDWPISKLAWPEKNQTDLPEPVRTGCEAIVNERRRVEYGSPIGFLSKN
jgi:Protein of unknown function (DUF1266)